MGKKKRKKAKRAKFIMAFILFLSILLLAVCVVIYLFSDNLHGSGEGLNDTSEDIASGSTAEAEDEAVSSLSEPDASLDEEETEASAQESEKSQDLRDYFTASRITDEIFERIDGVSYVANDDIALDDLRYLQVLYVGFDGDTHTGELIVNAAIADDILDIMYELYINEYQIERMELVDEYGADDELSMQANNTSAFNYRTVEGSSSLSMHSYGLAIDINPFYNPCVRESSDGSADISPEGSEAYADRDWGFAHKIDEDDLCYQLFMAHGFSWGGNWNSLKDYQHFYKEIT